MYLLGKKWPIEININLQYICILTKQPVFKEWTPLKRSEGTFLSMLL